jgi:uncharacterized membrane protein
MSLSATNNGFHSMPSALPAETSPSQPPEKSAQEKRMRLAAFSIYAVNAIISLVGFLGLFIIIPVAVITCIATFTLGKFCADALLKKHFAYQFRTDWIAAVCAIIVLAGLALLIYNLPGRSGWGFNITVLIYSLGCMAVIIHFLTPLWFLYRNIKGLVYLNKNKAI